MVGWSLDAKSNTRLMKVFKFGGASVKDAAGIKNLLEVIQSHSRGDLVVVISAMGKMTNAFENLVEAYRSDNENLQSGLEEIKAFHRDLINELEDSEVIQKSFDRVITDLETRLNRQPSDNYDFDYDGIVSFGEVLSTTIISEYLNLRGLHANWVDARRLIRTDNTYREGKVDWSKTSELVQEKWNILESMNGRRIMLTQGFIGHTAELNTTTLGREGSDFSAAIMAFALDAESVTIWKDVPGVLNADPKYFSDAVLLKRISYREAIELAYYGASVIHPKTIKPLQNKGIVLNVRSFLKPEERGTIIDSSTFSDSLVPSYIFKVNQILISFTPRDFSFVNEANLSELFAEFVKSGLRIHLMQNSALNFSICVDYQKEKLDQLLERFRDRYEVLHNHPCELVTIRHYDQETISRLLIGKKVLVEQRSRSTARMVLVES